MGNEITGKSGQLSQPPIPRTDGKRPERTAGNPPPANPRTGTADPRTDGTGTGTRKAEEKKVTGLATVTPDIPSPEPPKKKQTRKPKKKKDDPTSFNAEQLSALILSMSAIVGSRPDMEVFVLRPEEATQLATPIANMIAKSEKLQNMGEYADAISLVTASLVIFGPRCMIYHDKQKKKKIERNGGVQIVHKEPKGKGGNNKPSGTGPADVAEHDASIYSAIPSTI